MKILEHFFGHFDEICLFLQLLFYVTKIQRHLKDHASFFNFLSEKDRPVK